MAIWRILYMGVPRERFSAVVAQASAALWGLSRRPPAPPSMQRGAARYVEAGAGDVAGVLRKQERDRAADVVAGGGVAERAALGRVLGLLPAGLRIAGRDGVDADAVRADLLRQRLAEHDDGRL